MISRRDFIRICGVSGGAAMMPAWTAKLVAEPARYGLSDPALQPKFAYLVPNALDPAFRFMPDQLGVFNVALRPGMQQTGLVHPPSGKLLSTPIRNPEFFYSPGGRITGPEWDFVPGGFTTCFGTTTTCPRAISGITTMRSASHG